ncbi:MAG: TetR/AcrR family transcriptional regulator, partial [Thermodesulfobacteriota bacterium]|nr:TetR/AcrR family transcriptional regulator [Thermodesulfobacteriota bacterium]
MPGKATTNKPALKSQAKHLPPGHLKIMEALKTLLGEKQFNLITWAEIAETAGVTQGLIYKYFQDKRNLLYVVLADYLGDFLSDVESKIADINGGLNKLRWITHLTFKIYNENRVFAKILLLEVRSSPGYFQSETYLMVKNYA